VINRLLRFDQTGLLVKPLIKRANIPEFSTAELNWWYFARDVLYGMGGRDPAVACGIIARK
jgi:hypothetical protein